MLHDLNNAIYIVLKEFNKEKPDNRKRIIGKAATYLTGDINSHVSNLEKIAWPCTIYQFSF